MTSNPLFIIPDFFCIFQTNFAMATLGLKEMENSFGKVEKKVCPVGCLSFAKLGKLFSLPSQRNIPISFKPKVAIAEFF